MKTVTEQQRNVGQPITIVQDKFDSAGKFHGRNTVEGIGSNDFLSINCGRDSYRVLVVDGQPTLSKIPR